jgi:hypothetical protein
VAIDWCRLLQSGNDGVEGALFLASPGEPHVVLAHLLSGARAEGRLALVDELQGPLTLRGQFGQESGVGGELCRTSGRWST